MLVITRVYIIIQPDKWWDNSGCFPWKNRFEHGITLMQPGQWRFLGVEVFTGEADW
jgi:hypothetical protein